MNKQKENEFPVFINGIPNFESISEEAMEPLFTRLVDSILSEINGEQEK